MTPFIAGAAVILLILFIIEAEPRIREWFHTRRKDRP